MAYIKNWEYNPETNTLEINKKYEIDLYTGAIFYSWNWAGSRSAFFPSWLFAVRDAMQIQSQIERELAKLKK